MNFIAPFAFAFAATIPVVVIFYLLKRKRVVKLVPSTVLWQRFLSDAQANAPFQRLRHNWLLVLQILMLLLAVFALSRPFFIGHSTTSGFRVIILDASASMQSTDVKPSRFEKARAEALTLIDASKGETEVLVLQAGGSTEVKQSATTSKSALRRAINSCRVTDSPTRLIEALKLAETMARDRKSPEIHLFSDGAAAGLGELEDKGLAVIYHRIGERCDNLGVTTLDIRENPENREQRALYTSVANFSTNARQAELELLFENQVVAAKSLSIPGGETSPQVFQVGQPRDGVFTVRISSKDDLAADDQASIVSMLPQPVRVLMVSRGNRFLEKALKAAGDIELIVQPDCGDSAEKFDLVVLDDIVPTVWPKPNVLAIHVVNTNLFTEWSKIEAPAIVDWKNTHPLLRYINLDNVGISESFGVKAPSWAVSLVDAQQTPLVLAGELQRQRIVWIGFDTLQSTWPLRISFPIFIANAVQWLNPASGKSSQWMLRAGETFRFPLNQPIASAEVVLPDGTKQTIPAKEARELRFSDTARQGVYHVHAGTNEVDFCVNVLDAAESNTQPVEQLQFGKFTKITNTEIKRANVEIWRWLAGVALAVLMFEWWFFHKRTA